MSKRFFKQNSNFEFYGKNKSTILFYDYKSNTITLHFLKTKEVKIINLHRLYKESYRSFGFEFIADLLIVRKFGIFSKHTNEFFVGKNFNQNLKLKAIKIQELNNYLEIREQEIIEEAHEYECFINNISDSANTYMFTFEDHKYYQNI